MIALFKRFVADRRGLSAVEFALIAPVLIAFYFSTVEIDSALTVNRKVTSAASTVADLVAQDDIVDNSEINAIFTATAAIMAPYDPDDSIQVRISSVRLNQQNVPAVVWSSGHNIAPYTAGVGVTIPANLLTAGSTIVMTEVTFPYEAPLAEMLDAAIPMRETFYLRPRRGASVCRLSGTTTTC